MHQSFFVDVDEANTYVRAVARDDDADNEVEPFGTVESQQQTKMFLQTEEEYKGTAVGGAFIGTCLRSDSTGGDQRVAAGSLGVAASGSEYAPGFHYEKKVTATGWYVLHVFRTCSSAVGKCDASGREDEGKSFQFKIQVQTVKRGTLQWTDVRAETANDNNAVPAPVQKRGWGGAMVAVGDRYIVGVGGPTGASGATRTPMTVYDTNDGKEYTMPNNDDLDFLDFPAVVASSNSADKSFWAGGRHIVRCHSHELRL